MSDLEGKEVQVIDSHTGGEPTRIIIDGGPPLGGVTVADRRDSFRKHHDSFRSAVVHEPRGSAVLVGGLLCKPVDQTCTTGVIFFNNVGYLNMSGHGTIGLVVTLQFLGLAQPGQHKIETPAGIITARLAESGEVTYRNVASYRHRKDVAIDVEGYGRVTGDVAWGGNWFYLVSEHDQTVATDRIDELTDFTRAIRRQLDQQQITGKDGDVIDHIELFGPPTLEGANSKNFVLCPGGAYDRSPSGAGTSARLACMYEDGALKEGDIWRQESIVGSAFEGMIEVSGGEVYPRITGTAHITAMSKLILEDGDPFKMGIPI